MGHHTRYCSSEFEKSTPLYKIDESKEILKEEEEDEKSIGKKKKLERTQQQQQQWMTKKDNDNNNDATATVASLEEYKLDQENQIKLAEQLKWNSLMNWDFDIFKVS